MTSPTATAIRPSPNSSSYAARTDEELMLDLARGQHEALRPLHARYASLILHVASQSLGWPAAEEVLQEVWVALWRDAARFDPDQGAFRPWLLRVLRWKILNQLRQRRHQPPLSLDTPAPDETEEPAQQVPDQAPGPDQRAWQREQEAIVWSALAALPPKQRQAIALAFLSDLTHEQVAATLRVPLGTAKTRIRVGLRQLRAHLAPVAPRSA